MGFPGPLISHMAMVSMTEYTAEMESIHKTYHRDSSTVLCREKNPDTWGPVFPLLLMVPLIKAVAFLL